MGRLFGPAFLGCELFGRGLLCGYRVSLRLGSEGGGREGLDLIDIPPDERACRQHEPGDEDACRDPPKDLSVNPLKIQLPNLRAIKWTTDLSNTNARHAIPFKEAREVLLSPSRQHKAAVIVNSDHNVLTI